QDERHHPPPAVLPREGVVVVALGSFKALLHPTACLIFDAGRADMVRLAPALAELMKENAKVGAHRVLCCGRACGGGGGAAAVAEKGWNHCGRLDAVLQICRVKKREKRKKDTPRSAMEIPAAAIHHSEKRAPHMEDIEEADARRPAPSASVSVDSREGGGGEAGGEGTITPRLGNKDGGGGGADDDTDTIKEMFREQDPMPFELAMLEAMFQEVCSGYHRRAHIVRRLIKEGLKPRSEVTTLQPQRIDFYRV
ncbi:unnamed protein product, partial [Discosporangium mesarthrocarpum]